MLTINTALPEIEAHNDSDYQNCDIRWFNLSSSPFEDACPENENLFSPSLTVEMLSPPCVTEKAASPIPWETPCVKEKTYRSSMLRDCYLHELSNSLETTTHQALHILKHKTDRALGSKDVTYLIDNAINNEIRCLNLSNRQLAEVKEKLERVVLQSLSSSGVKEPESAE